MSMRLVTAPEPLVDLFCEAMAFVKVLHDYRAFDDERLHDEAARLVERYRSVMAGAETEAVLRRISR
jgi:hypothetical protein